MIIIKKLFFILPLLVLLHSSAHKSDMPGNVLRSLGYDISPVAEIKDVIIPSEFDPVYENYNLIQLESGYDLTPYKGCRCVMYTYEILNHPFGPVRGNVLTYEGRVIGGDISSVNINGFMQGLS